MVFRNVWSSCSESVNSLSLIISIRSSIVCVCVCVCVCVYVCMYVCMFFISMFTEKGFRYNLFRLSVPLYSKVTNFAFLLSNLKLFSLLCCWFATKPYTDVNSNAMDDHYICILYNLRDATYTMFHCFTVHFYSLSFILTNSCTFS